VLSKKLKAAINEQINKELYSAYLYLSMAAHLDASNLPGAAHWMRAQFREEQEHAMKFYRYLYERGGQVTLKPIDGPPTEFGSVLSIFEQVLEHEKKVTGLINDLYALALSENDYASQIFFQWFVSEQVEEEESATQVIETLKMVGEKGQALFLLDRQLAQRGAD
jgi:ferritin